MKAHWKSITALTLTLSLAGCSAPPPGSADSATLTPQALTSTLQQLVPGGQVSMQTALTGSDELQFPEFGPNLEVADGPNANTAGGSGLAKGMNRRLPGTVPGQGVVVTPQAPAITAPALQKTFNGLNHRDTRTANGGNQFSNEPPDQGLCVGNGFLLETVNSVLRVYGTDGSAKTAPIALNAFYGYQPAILRTATPPVYGPNLFDPSCHYDAASGRWFHLTDNLAVNPSTGRLTGKNTLDLAVSVTSDPTGPWRVYRLPVQNDGTDGTPNHGTGPNLGDYPHLGMDANGVYITTNEFPLTVDGYNGVNIYAIPKAQLVSGAPNPTVVSYYLNEGATSVPAFTLMPSKSPGTNFSTASNGTEYFVSSLAVFGKFGASNRLAVWSLTNTASLNSAAPSLNLSVQAVQVNTYAVPNPSPQKPGPFPLGECLNDVSGGGSGTPCWAMLGFLKNPGSQEKLAELDSGDSRVQQVMYAGGKLWTTLSTAVFSANQSGVGAAWYVLNPQGKSTSVTNQGIVSVPGKGLLYPSVAVTDAGTGAVGVTLVSPEDHPSAAYFGISERGVSPLVVAAAGQGTQDGFSGYKAYGSPIRPRWGDYAAAATDGTNIWMANEYIAAGCTLNEYLASPFGSCGGTRTALANWATRITQVKAP